MMDSLNRLRGTRTYLVGAMDRVPDGGAGWRNKITPELEKLGINVVNPCDNMVGSKVLENEETRGWIEYYKETKQYDKIRAKFGMIRSVDLRCIDVCDFIIARIDLDVHACGTYEEIVTANRQKKPVLTYCKQGKSKAPNWLFFMLPHEYIFDSMEDIIVYLHKINHCVNIDDLDRWVFFNNFTTGK
jgi:hypothetical protein